MDPFHEFRTQSSSSSLTHDSFQEFRVPQPSTHDSFSEFRTRTKASNGSDAFAEFRLNAQPRGVDAFNEFRISHVISDAFAEFRSPRRPATTIKRERQLRVVAHGADTGATPVQTVTTTISPGLSPATKQEHIALHSASSSRTH